MSPCVYFAVIYNPPPCLVTWVIIISCYVHRLYGPVTLKRFNKIPSPVSGFLQMVAYTGLYSHLISFIKCMLKASRWLTTQNLVPILCRIMKCNLAWQQAKFKAWFADFIPWCFFFYVITYIPRIINAYILYFININFQIYNHMLTLMIIAIIYFETSNSFFESTVFTGVNNRYLSITSPLMRHQLPVQFALLYI